MQEIKNGIDRTHLEYDDIEQKMDATNGIGWLCCFDSVV